MSPYLCKGTKSTPEINFDAQSAHFVISGRSMPEDAYGFYKDAISWMENYIDQPQDFTRFEIKLEYFNSGSVKQVFVLLCMMEEILQTGKEAEVIWYYKKGDELMHQKGHEFSKFLDLPMKVQEN